MADGWCNAVLNAGAVTLVLAALVSGWTDQRRGPQLGALPGLDAFLAGLLVVQVALLVALVVTVGRQAGRVRLAVTARSRHFCAAGLPRWWR